MTDSIDTFFSAWSMAEDGLRAETIARAVAPGVTYADPRTEEPITGADALNAYVGAFSANAPGWRADVVRSDTIAGTARATVAFGGKGPDGAEMVQLGQYFVEFDDAGLITRMTGFVGTGAPE